MKLPTATALNTRISFKSKSNKRQKESTVASYSEWLNYLSETFASDIVVSETVSDRMPFTQLSNDLPAEYAKALWNKAIMCHTVQISMYSKAVS